MKVCESQVHIFMQLDACTMRTTPFSPWSIKLSRLKTNLMVFYIIC